MIRRLLAHTALACITLLVMAAAAFAQGADARYSLNCNNQDNYSSDARAHHCEVKEQTLAATGGVSLRRLGGNVTGETVNGGLSIELTGSNWDGEGLNVKTTNGGLSVSVPDNYSAHLETGTVNGGFVVSPSIAEITRETKRLSLDLGSGGQNLRFYTTNGGVSIKRRESR